MAPAEATSGEAGTDIERFAELARQAAVPVAILQLAGTGRDRVVTSTAAAAEAYGGTLDGVEAESLLGRPAWELELLREGKLTAFEAETTIISASGDPVDVTVWVRTVDRAGSALHAIAVLGFTGGGADWKATESPATSAVTCIGCTDARLNVERVSQDIEELTGTPASHVLGTALVDLVSDRDVGPLLIALGRVASSRHGASLLVQMRSGTEGRPCELFLVPLEPAPSVAFAIQEVSEEGRSGRDPVGAVLARMRAAVLGAEASQRISGTLTNSPELSRLTSRELQIVERLAQGDRVPAISRRLFLSQSTVRSHLSQVFTKLGLSSQQELIDLLRTRNQHTVQ